MTRRSGVWLVGMATALAFVPLIRSALTGTEFAFTGTDDQAAGLVGQIAPDYRPWFQSLWRPASGEVQSFLFALQAALGAGVLGYCLGYRRGRQDGEPAEAPGKADARH